MLQSILRQGILSSYRRHYWKYLFQLLRRWRRHPQKRWQGLVLLISGHHFIEYAVEVAAELDPLAGGVEAHGGRIEADNDSDLGGARFTLTLPVDVND